MRTARLRHVLTVLFALIMMPTLAAAQDDGDATTKPADAAPAPDVMQYVKVETNQGIIVLALNETKAPKSTKNFVKYVEAEFFDGTIFHRVISNFMIQGGGFTEDLKRKETMPPIENEWTNGLKNMRGTIAMARTGNPNSATSQFFINVKDNANLDRPISGGAGYAVFGKVVVGMKVVDEIRAAPTQALSRAFQNIPLEPIVMKKMTMIDADAAQAMINAEKAAASDESTEKDAEGGGRVLGKPGGDV